MLLSMPKRLAVAHLASKERKMAIGREDAAGEHVLGRGDEQDDGDVGKHRHRDATLPLSGRRVAAREQRADAT